MSKVAGLVWYHCRMCDTVFSDTSTPDISTTMLRSVHRLSPELGHEIGPQYMELVVPLVCIHHCDKEGRSGVADLIGCATERWSSISREGPPKKKPLPEKKR